MKKGVICLGPDLPGEDQMDLDRQMLLATEYDKITRVRLYNFDPPAISLGFHQKFDEIDLEKCQKRGYDVVKRPTGGRAVLHKGDIVYSISVAQSGVRESGPLHKGVYNLVSLAQINAIRKAGVAAAGTDNLEFKNVSEANLPRMCFSSATKHEVQVDGRKVVGSAQRRGHEAILQHGSILLEDDHLELSELLPNVDSEKSAVLKKYLRSRTISLEEAGYSGKKEELIELFVNEFDNLFGPFDRISSDAFVTHLHESEELVL